MSNTNDENLTRATLERMEAVRESPDEAKTEALACWIRESPRHAASFVRQSDIDEALCEGARNSGRSLAEWIEIGRAAYAADARAERRRTQPAYRPFVSIAAGVTIVAALGLAASMWWWSYGSWVDYRAVAADARPRVLADGSSIQLYARSFMQVRMVLDRRDVRLREGGGTYEVRHDSKHPFRVRTERATFEALGTRFNVLRKGDVTGVYVSDGAVRASGERQSVLLHAGGSADISGSGLVTELHEAPRDRDAGPQTLGRLAEEVNRRNHLPRIRIEGGARNLRFTSSVDLDNPDTWVRSLATYDTLRVVHEGDRVTISLREE